jgi:hypothetical protein
VDDSFALRQRTQLVAVALAAAVAGGCSAVRPRPANRLGILPCAAGAASALLSVDALECWFDARHGRWRTLSHESHFDVLVVKVQADDLRDAEDIARRFVAGERATFSEILVYVQRESRGEPARIRRVRWTRTTDLETIDFDPGGT